MKGPKSILCNMWEEKLATLCPDDLLPTEREALDGHVASCPFCAAMLAEYGQIDTLLRSTLIAKRSLGLEKVLYSRKEQEKRLWSKPNIR